MGTATHPRQNERRNDNRDTRPKQQEQNFGFKDVKEILNSIKRRLAEIESGLADDTWLSGLKCDIKLIDGSVIQGVKIVKTGKFNLIISEEKGKNQSILPKQSVLQYINIKV